MFKRNKLIYSFCIIAALSTSFFSHAAVKTFTGTANFSSAANWNGGTLPIAGDDLEINGACTFDDLANNFSYGSLKIGITVASSLSWPVGGTNILDVTAVIAPSVAGNILDMTEGGTLKNGGTLTGSVNLTFIAGTGTFEYTSAGAHNIASKTYYNLHITNAGVATLSGAITVNNDLKIAEGTLASSTFQITGNAVGTFTMAAGTTLTLGTTASATNVSFPTGYTAGNINLEPTSTITYQANTASQNISSIPTYGNLTITVGASAITKTPTGNSINVAGNLSLGATANLTLSVTTHTVNLTGNLSGTGRLSFSSGVLNIGGDNTQTGTFTCGTGSVDYNGGGAQIVRGGTTYKNLIFSNSGTKTLAAGTTNISGTFFIIGSAAADLTTNSTTVAFNFAGAQSIAAANYYNLTLSTSGVKTLAAGTIGVANTFATSGTAAIDATTNLGTVDYNGGGAQSVKIANYYDLTLSNAGLKTFVAGTTGVANALSITGAATVNATTAATIIDYNGGGAQAIAAMNYSSLTLSNSGTKTFPVGTTGVKTNFTISGTAVADAITNSSTVDYNGTGAQNVAGITYYDLTISGSGTCTQTGPATINNNLTITGGTFATSTFTVTGNAVGTLSMSPGTTLNLGTTTSANNIPFPTDFISANIKLDVASTVVYRANTASQQISDAPTYGNLTVSGSSVASKTLAGPYVYVAGNLSLPTTNVTLDLTTNTLTVAGSLIAGTGKLSMTSGLFQIGGSYSNTGSFTRGTGTVDYNGTGSQNIRGMIYNNLTKSGIGSATLSAATTISSPGNLTINAGDLHTNTFAITGNAAGTLTLGSGASLYLGKTTSATSISFPSGFIASNIILDANSTVLYQSNTASQQVSTIATYGNLIVTTGATVISKLTSASSNTLTVSGDLTITTLTLSLAAKTINLTGDLSGDGALTFTTGNLNIGGNNTQTGGFNCGTGRVDYNGSGTQIVRSTNYYNLIFSTGGTKELASGEIAVLSTFTVNGAVTIDPETNLNTFAYDRAGTQNVIPVNYYNLLLSNTGVKTVLSGTVGIAGTYSVTGTASWDNTTNLPAFDFNGSGDQTINNFDYNHLKFSNAGNKSIPTNTLNIAGNFSINDAAVAVLTTNSVTVNFNGAGGQIVSGNTTDFYNINVADGTGVSLQSSQNLINTIILNSIGTFTTGGFLTLISTANRTACIPALAVPDNFTGNITMQRYITAGIEGDGYRYFGPAISGLTLSSLNDDLYLTGLIGSQNSSQWPNVYTYKESKTGAMSNGWVNATNITNPMSTGVGYAVYVYSTDLMPDKTIDFTGPINKGNITFTITYTSYGSSADDGWNLVSNPYPCAVDWDAAGWTKNDLETDTYYAWDNENNQYATWTTGFGGTGGGTNIIASSQGFMVHADGVSPALGVVEDVKISDNPAPQFWKTSNSMTQVGIKLKIQNSVNPFVDEAVVRFVQGTTENKDKGFDASKLPSSNPSTPYIATETKDSNIVFLNTIPDFTKKYDIDVYVKAGINATYAISRELVNGFPNTVCLNLEDLNSGIITDLQTDSIYTFSLPVTSNPVKRFVLHISPGVSSSQSISSNCNGENNGQVIISSYSSASWGYVLKDSLGNIVSSASNLTAVDTVIKGLTPGKYFNIYTNSENFCNSSFDSVVVTEPAVLTNALNATDVSCKGLNNGIATVNVNGGTPPYSLIWSNTATENAISNLTPGKYFVTITDANDCASLTDSITIMEGPALVTAGFNASADTIYLLGGSANLQLTNTSNGATIYNWNFGDNATDTVGSPIHTYSLAGTYSIQLKASDAGGCIDSIQKNVVVMLSALGITDNNISNNNFSATSSASSIIITWNNAGIGNLNVGIYNNLGQRIFSQENIPANKGYVNINMDNKPTGSYFIRVNSSGTIWNKKVFYGK